MVQQVKRFVSGFILEPFVMSPTQTLAELDKWKDTKGAVILEILQNMRKQLWSLMGNSSNTWDFNGKIHLLMRIFMGRSSNNWDSSGQFILSTGISRRKAPANMGFMT
jgi:hypothetical protein